MKNRGVSLIEIVFSVGVITLVLTGVAMLIVNVTNVKRKSAERQVAISLSHKLVEEKILELKNANNSVEFWLNKKEEETGNFEGEFSNYRYLIKYQDCDSNMCKIIFEIKWGDENKPESLSVERLFSRTGI